MTRDELLEAIAEVQRHQSELDNIEVKSALHGTPRRIYEPLSAFANRTGGGLLLFGLDEGQNFEVCGGGDAHRLQSEISDVAADQMEPALRPEFTVGEVEGKTVVAVEVPEVSAEVRPCHYKTPGLQGGSYIRVGNSNRRMTDYEIFGYVSARQQPRFDEEIIDQGTLEDLDHERLEQYVRRLRQLRPQATFLSRPFEDILTQLGVVARVGGTVRPTLAGLLVFGIYPQRFEPQLVVTYLQFYGTTETEKTPRGERFLDNRKFEGTIPDMVERTVNHILANIRRSSLIEGLWRRDIPEYPEEAVREAVINAVAHRDYSSFVRGSYIQVRLFADRLEIQSPGGLYGNVTEETLEQEQSTRNRVLVRLMEDLQLVENRGSGISTMIEAMRAATLEPPRFQDKRFSFWVTFRNHTLMSPAAITWLNQFADKPLTDAQRLALVYSRSNDTISNNDYQRLNRVDGTTAYRDLRSLVQSGLIEPHGVGRWTYYTLVPAKVAIPSPPRSDEERVIAYVRERGSITRAQSVELLQTDTVEVRNLLRRMRRRGVLRIEGSKRSARYVLP